NFRAHTRGDGLCAHVRDGLQPNRGPQIRCVEPAHGPTALARGKDFAAQRLGSLGCERGGTGWRELLAESNLLLSLADRAARGVLLLTHETFYGLHACLSRSRVGAGAHWRVAGRARRFWFCSRECA